MHYNVLVIDDDTLMRPGLAVHLERTGHWRSCVAGAADAPALIQDSTPEVIFLTARRAKLDQVLGPELGAGNNVAKLFDLGEPLARIKTAIVALVASIAARWRQIWVPAST